LCERDSGREKGRTGRKRGEGVPDCAAHESRSGGSERSSAAALQRWTRWVSRKREGMGERVPRILMTYEMDAFNFVVQSVQSVSEEGWLNGTGDSEPFPRPGIVNV
jgi:hypothetical protein